MPATNSAQVAAQVAVLMTAYKAERTINEAVGSILANEPACDILVVDDCSPVPVADVLPAHERISVLRLEKNSGPGPARNIGIGRLLEKGYPYIAVMDADDIALPGKFARQRAFLEQNPLVGAVGTWARFFDEATGETVFFSSPPPTPEGIRQAMFFNLPMVHPSSMMRADVFRVCGVYDSRYRTAEDYELLRRIAQTFDLANLPEHLFDYRMSSRGQSLANRQRQLSDRLRIQLEYFEALSWRAWAGIAQTLLLFAMPNALLVKIKSWQNAR
jgi:glycosyltransferase involved in cell wall biosynthesis